MKQPVFAKLLAFLDRLEADNIDYTLTRNRDEALMVLIAVPGERWEVEFFADGSVEVEKFVSQGEIYGEDAVQTWLAEQGDLERNEAGTPDQVPALSAD